MNKQLTPGDYVLATKYSDGDPKDHFAIGFFSEILKYKSGDRYIVIDSEGKEFRRNGFRRCEKISQRIGKILIDNICIIEQGCASVWYWRHHAKQLEKIGRKFNLRKNT
ncbi:MAG: hypothetical protein ABFD15_06085 [Methanofastidiosum sp.]